MLSRLAIAFLPRGKSLLISWLQSPSTVFLEPKKIKSVTISIVSPSICHEVMGPNAMILVFCMLSFKPDFSLISFTFIKRLFNSSSFPAIRALLSEYLHMYNCAVVWTFFGPSHSLGLEWKLNFSSPVATAEFFIFAGVLSAALQQHHLLGFEIVQLEFHHLH